MQNNFTNSNYDYPTDTIEACNLLVNYKTTHSNMETILVENLEEVSFTNVGGSEGKSNSYKRDGGGSDYSERQVQ